MCRWLGARLWLDAPAAIDPREIVEREGGLARVIDRRAIPDASSSVSAPSSRVAGETRHPEIEHFRGLLVASQASRLAAAIARRARRRRIDSSTTSIV
jgi:hypothetical protein